MRKVVVWLIVFAVSLALYPTAIKLYQILKHSVEFDIHSSSSDVKEPEALKGVENLKEGIGVRYFPGKNKDYIVYSYHYSGCRPEIVEHVLIEHKKIRIMERSANYVGPCNLAVHTGKEIVEIEAGPYSEIQFNDSKIAPLKKAKEEDFEYVDNSANSF